MFRDDTTGLPAYRHGATMRALAALPAGGLFDSSAPFVNTAKYQYVLLYCAYKRGAVNGAFRMQLSYRLPELSSSAAYRTLAYSQGPQAAGLDAISLVQAETFDYKAIGNPEEFFVIGPIRIGEAQAEARVLACETGVPLTPGTLRVEARFF